MKKLNEAYIQNILYDFFQNLQHIMIIPNFYYSLNQYEADLISITQAKFVHECEIKISKSDFKADFKNKKAKHYNMQNDVKNKRKRLPNYFWFVAPENIINVKDIPEYSGLIEIKKSPQDHYYCAIIKQAPRLHNHKIATGWLLRMGKGAIFRYWRLRRQK